MWIYIALGLTGGFVLLLCLCLAVANFSYENFKEKYTNLDRYQNSNGITTLQYVKQINQNNFNSKIAIESCGQFQDCYYSGRVALSGQTMQSNSLASLSIVSHELGHARQDFSGNTLKKHISMRRAGRFCGMFFMPLMIVGAIMCLLFVFGVLPQKIVLYCGIVVLALAVIIFLFAIILKYKEIKIERQASDFAVEFLAEILTAGEVKMCKDFLDSARLTYWGGLFRTMFGWTFLTQKDKMFK